MTDTTTVEPDDQGVTDASPVADHGDTSSPNREAANYRRRLRETERERDTVAAERDALSERVSGFQRREVEQSIKGRLHDAGDFWRHAELAEVLDDDGHPDATKVDAVLDKIKSEAGHLLVPPPDLMPGRRGEPITALKRKPDIGSIFDVIADPAHPDFIPPSGKGWPHDQD
jgi:hypothetical protein